MWSVYKFPIWVKDRIAYCWQSGPNGKMLIIGVLTGLFVIGILTGGEEENNHSVTEIANTSESVLPTRPSSVAIDRTKAVTVAGGGKEEKYYECEQCFCILEAPHMPSGGGKCSARKNAPHRWVELGVAGENCYQCRKCGESVQTKYLPIGRKCSAEKNGNHSWQKQ